MSASHVIPGLNILEAGEDSFTRRGAVNNQVDWESLWAPYDEPTYQAVLAEIQPNDFVLEIGAGDLRLARRLAAKARRVEAVEIQTGVLAAGTREPIPSNLIVHQADALTMPFPGGLISAVLLMRHCTHYSEYVARLRNVGCQRLITNARWHFGVEVIQLYTPRIPFDWLELGWYGCECGAAGFKSGPIEKYGQKIDTIVIEVCNCPNCL